jgi:uncharacterized protein YjiK
MRYYDLIYFLVSIILLFDPFIHSQEKSNSLLSEYNFEGATLLKLNKSLKEVSGLALLNDKEILAHNDEEGIVYTLKITNFDLTGKLKIGDEKVQKDFEGIAVVKDSVYMVTSNGVIFKFNHLTKTETADFNMFKTSLKIENDVEGLCYDKTTNSLLLACKNEPGMGNANSRTIYSFNLKKMSLERSPRFVISLKELMQKFGFKDFAPSGIEKNPVNGNFYVLSSNPPSIIELNSQGKILAATRLNPKINPQPEGITFLKDGTMLISDEGQKKSGTISAIKLKAKSKK